MLRLKGKTNREIMCQGTQHVVQVFSSDPDDTIEFLADVAAQLLIFMQEKDI